MFGGLRQRKKGGRGSSETDGFEMSLSLEINSKALSKEGTGFKQDIFFLFPLRGNTGDATMWQEIKTVGNRTIAHILKQTCVAGHINQSEKSPEPPEALPAIG